MRALVFLLAVLTVSPRPGSAYVRERSRTGAPLQRSDSANISFKIHDSVAAGVTNREGAAIITRDSDPAVAVQAALNAWSAVPTAAVRFAPVEQTATRFNPQDRINVISFEDTDEIRSVVGGATAVTLTLFFSDGTLVASDIVFNPAPTSGGRPSSFSTNRAPGTIDLQSVVEHEVGHALGADHSGLIGSMMYYAGDAIRNLSSDDIAFLTEAYPAAGNERAFGSLSGKITYADGSPVRNASVVAIDGTSGFAFQTLTAADGRYTIGRVLPGKYFVYAEPLGFPAGVVGLDDSEVDTDFQTNFLGGAGSPQQVEIGGGAAASADLSVVLGKAQFGAQFSGFRNAGGSGNFVLTSAALLLPAGQDVDLFLFGPGLDSSIRAQDVRLLGGAFTIRPGTVTMGPDSFLSGGQTLTSLRMTLDAVADAGAGMASLVIQKGGVPVVVSGLLSIQPAPAFDAAGVANAASFVTGPVSPGELVTIFGKSMGPRTLTVNALDARSGYATFLAGTAVSFDGVPAPLIYSSSTQVSAQVPYEVAGKSSANMQVWYNGVAAGTVAPVAAAKPGIFAAADGRQAIVVNQDNTINAVGAPAARGQAVVIYCTGLGAVSPPVPTGLPAPANTLSGVNGVTVTIGGVNARVLFGGLAPTWVGLYQVNAIVPETVQPGAAVELRIAVNGIASKAGVALAVR